MFCDALSVVVGDINDNLETFRQFWTACIFNSLVVKCLRLVVYF